METISNVTDLKNQVRLLEMKRIEKEQLLKDHAAALLDEAKPINILKRAVVNSNVVKSTFTKKGLTGNLIQIGAGFLLNRIFKRKR